MSSQSDHNFLTQQLFSKFQILNSTPPNASTNELLQVVDQILDSRYFSSIKFTNVLTITIGRLFNAVASEKASRSDFINILNKLNTFTKSTLNNQHFHTAMYEFFKILKYSVSMNEGITKTVSFGSESSFNFESSSINSEDSDTKESPLSIPKTKLAFDLLSNNIPLIHSKRLLLYSKTILPVTKNLLLQRREELLQPSLFPAFVKFLQSISILTSVTSLESETLESIVHSLFSILSSNTDSNQKREVSKTLASYSNRANASKLTSIYVSSVKPIKVAENYTTLFTMISEILSTSQKEQLAGIFQTALKSSVQYQHDINILTWFKSVGLLPVYDFEEKLANKATKTSLKCLILELLEGMNGKISSDVLESLYTDTDPRVRGLAKKSGIFVNTDVDTNPIELCLVLENFNKQLTDTEIEYILKFCIHPSWKVRSKIAEILSLQRKTNTDQMLYELFLFDEVEKVSQKVEFQSESYLKRLLINVLYSSEKIKVINSANAYVKIFDTVITSPTDETQAAGLFKFLMAKVRVDYYQAVIPMLSRQFYCKTFNPKLIFPIYRWSFLLLKVLLEGASDAKEFHEDVLSEQILKNHYTDIYFYT